MFLPSAPSFTSIPSKELAESPSSRESLPNGLPAMLNNTSLRGTHSQQHNPVLCERQPERSRLLIAHRFSPFLLPKQILALHFLSTCSGQECVEALAEHLLVCMNEKQPEKAGCMSKERRWGVEGRRYCAFFKRRKKEGRSIFSLGFPAGINWEKEQKRIG